MNASDFVVPTLFLALILTAWGLLVYPDQTAAIAGTQLVVALLAIQPQQKNDNVVFWGNETMKFLLYITFIAAAALPILRTDQKIKEVLGIVFYVTMVASLLLATNRGFRDRLFIRRK